MKNYTSSMPLLPIFVGLVVGIAMGLAVGFSPWWSVAVVILAVISIWLKNTIVAVLLAAIAIGWLVVSCRVAPSFHEDMYGVSALYRGTVESVNEGETSRRVVLTVTACGPDSDNIHSCQPFKAALYVGSMLPPVQSGDDIRVLAKFIRPERETDLPYESDYTQSLKMQGIETTAFVSSSDVSVCGVNDNYKYKLMRCRELLSDLLLRSSLSAETAYFLNAVLLGDTSMLFDGLRDAFVAAGMAHLLALSGMHVAIIAMLIAIALFPLRVVHLKHFRLVITIILLWIYAVMTGLAPSVVRAVIMATLILFGYIIRRDSSPLNNLCLAAIVILLFDPMALTAPGFQLSFVAVLSILVIAPSINPVNHRTHPWLYKCVSWAAVCIAAVLGTGMLSAYYFHTYPLYFLFGNLIAVFVMPILMGGAILLLILEAFGLDPIWLCDIVNRLYGIIVWSADTASSLTGSTVSGLYFQAWVLIPYYTTVALLILLVVKQRMIYAVGMCCGIAIVAFSIYITVPVLPTTEYFVTRNAYRTDIIVRNGSDAYLLTTAQSYDTEGVIAECMQRYDEYFGRSGVTQLKLLPDTCAIDGISRKGAFLSIGSDTYLVLKRGTQLPISGQRVRYALVCRGYSGNVTDLSEVADTVLLSRDVDHRRHDRYAEQLRKESMPYRSLRNNGYRRILHQELRSCSYPCLK